MRVEDDEKVAREKAGQIGDVVRRVEADTKAARLGAAVALGLSRATDALDRLEVGVGEGRVIAAEERGVLEGRRRRAECEALGACRVGAQVEQRVEARGAGVVGVLQHLGQQRGVGVGGEHVAYTRGEVDLLSKVAHGGGGLLGSRRRSRHRAERREGATCKNESKNGSSSIPSSLEREEIRRSTDARTN